MKLYDIYITRPEGFTIEDTHFDRLVVGTMYALNVVEQTVQFLQHISEEGIIVEYHARNENESPDHLGNIGVIIDD